MQYGDWSQDANGKYKATLLTAAQVNEFITIIDGKPYSYSTNYAKREFHGSAIPKFYGSFNINVAWKDLTLSTLFTYQIGGKVLDYNYSSLMSAGSSPSSFHKDILGAWTVNDATAESAIWSGTVPLVNYDVNNYYNATSSRFLTSAGYLCLKNINLSYKLPKFLVKKLDLEDVGLSLTCENLFTKTARKGMNPQQTYDGTQYNYLVTPRVFSVGLNVKF